MGISKFTTKIIRIKIMQSEYVQAVENLEKNNIEVPSNIKEIVYKLDKERQEKISTNTKYTSQEYSNRLELLFGRNGAIVELLDFIRNNESKIGRKLRNKQIPKTWSKN